MVEQELINYCESVGHGMDTCRILERFQNMKHDLVAMAPKIFKRKNVRGSTSEVHNEGEANLVTTFDVQVQNTGRENANNMQRKDLNNMEGIHWNVTNSEDDEQTNNSEEGNFVSENVSGEDSPPITNRNQIPLGSISGTNSPKEDTLYFNQEDSELHSLDKERKSCNELSKQYSSCARCHWRYQPGSYSRVYS